MAYAFETVALGLQLAMGIATVEGEITHTSGKLLKDWALDEIERHPAADRQELKDVLNQAMKDAYRRSLKSDLDLIAMAESFSRSPDEVLKSRIITLCRMIAGDDDRNTTITLIADLSRIIGLSTQSPKSAVGPESYSSASDQTKVRLPSTLQERTQPASHDVPRTAVEAGIHDQVCPRCASPVQASDRFCTGCGHQLATVAVDSSAGGLEEMPFRFSGRAAEYFKIWIVNLALTIVTLGIYSAWAKVRNKRYFYRNTTVAGSAFDYHALPIQILKGRLLVVGAWILYSVCASFFPMFSVLLLVLFYLCVPWLVVRAYVFNARNSSWRNIRFNFNSKSIGEAAKIYILFPLLAPLTLGFIGPYITFLSWRFVIDNNRLGRQPFKINLSTGRYYSAFFIAFGICLIFIVAIGSVGILILYFVNDSEGVVGFFQISFVAIIPAFLIARVTYRVIVRNRSLTRTMIGAYRFNSTLRVPALCWIYFSNLIAVIFSLGLLIPWAKVRVARYVAEHLEMYGPKNVDSFVQAEQRSANVFGEEAADFFDIDLGGV